MSHRLRRTFDEIDARRVAHLLTETDLTVEEIAAQLEFSVYALRLSAPMYGIDLRSRSYDPDRLDEPDENGTLPYDREQCRVPLGDPLLRRLYQHHPEKAP